MAKHERDFPVAGAPLSLDQLLALIDRPAGEGDRTREDAIACYLSSADGWNEAVKMLGGAFAAGETGLRSDKDD